jgi:hypothetical protein
MGGGSLTPIGGPIPPPALPPVTTTPETTPKRRVGQPAAPSSVKGAEAALATQAPPPAMGLPQLPPAAQAATAADVPTLYDVLLQICLLMGKTTETLQAQRKATSTLSDAIQNVTDARDKALQETINYLGSIVKPPAWVHWVTVVANVLAATIVAVEVTVVTGGNPYVGALAGMAVGAALTALEETHVIGPGGMIDQALVKAGYSDSERKTINFAINLAIVLVVSLMAGGAANLAFEQLAAQQAAAAAVQAGAGAGEQAAVGAADQLAGGAAQEAGAAAAQRVMTVTDKIKAFFSGLSPFKVGGEGAFKASAKTSLYFGLEAARRTHMVEMALGDSSDWAKYSSMVIDMLMGAAQMQMGASSLGQLCELKGLAGASKALMEAFPVLLTTVPMGVTSSYQLHNGRFEVMAADPSRMAAALDGIKDVLMASLQNSQSAPKSVVQSQQALSDLAKQLSNIPMEMRG